MGKIIHQGIVYGGGDGSSSSSSLPMYRLLFNNGTDFLHREYVRQGDDALYSYGENTWGTSPSGPIVPNILQNIQEDKELYYINNN